jgi:hypothetical protein
MLDHTISDRSVAALQAVMAQQLGGDTLHHACGINPFGEHKPQDDKSRGKASQRQANVAEQVMQWCWLIIDEVSMVSAKLLAEIDIRLRQMVRAKHTLRGDAQGFARAFGGINILFSGDFWQLDPSSGVVLAEIPAQYVQRAKKFDPKPEVARAQAIFWRGGQGSLRGVTELTECVRAQDPWLLEVQNQMRAGELSEDICDCLHRRETTVLGSWVGGACVCGRRACRTSWRATRQECEQ